MKHILPKYIILAVLLMSFSLLSCAGHGRVSMMPRHETDALVENLLSQTDQYVVHYHGNSQKLVSGILFDPKEDERQLRPEGSMWQETSDPEAIAVIVFTILTTSEPNYFPNVYQITDPDGTFYGYLITGWTGVAIKPVDEQTLKVYGLKGPPEYEDRYPGGR